MAAVEMRKLTVIGLNSGRAPFIYELMHLGVVEINSQDGMVNDEDWMPDIFRTSNSADVSRLEGDIIRVSSWFSETVCQPIPSCNERLEL